MFSRWMLKRGDGLEGFPQGKADLCCGCGCWLLKEIQKLAERQIWGKKNPSRLLNCRLLKARRGVWQNTTVFLPCFCNPGVLCVLQVGKSPQKDLRGAGLCCELWEPERVVSSHYSSRAQLEGTWVLQKHLGAILSLNSCAGRCAGEICL